MAGMERNDLDSMSGNGHDVNDIKEMASAKIQEAREWSEKFLGRVETQVRERPATSILIALGTGYLIGRIARYL